MTTLKTPKKPNLIDRFAYAIADRVADRVADQIASQIPAVAEAVTRAVLAETASTVGGMPQGVAEWVRKLAGGR